MRYTVRHVTRFTYDTPITESVMEVRMQPRTEGSQRCIHFGLGTSPTSRVMMYQDDEGNTVHHFNIPGRHSRLTLTAEAVVDSEPSSAVPDALDAHAWRALSSLTGPGEFWELLAPTAFARPTPLLEAFAREIDLTRGHDPLSTLRRLMEEMYARFEYSPQSTRVDSPIDEALSERKGVCQDFAHVFIALARQLGIPCRYVSGYLYRNVGATDRSSDGATHAWAEALLPDVGWAGFDPTNNLIAEERHIRVAVGRDYADVPPTRGVYKGAAGVRSELAVAVQVGPAHANHAGEKLLAFAPWMSRDAVAPLANADGGQQ